MTKQQSKRGGVRAWGVILLNPIYGMQKLSQYLCQTKKQAVDFLGNEEGKIIPVLITPIIKKARAKAQIKTRK